MEKTYFASPEEFGIYLSCRDSLAYNLPLLLPLGKEGDYEKASKALQILLSLHPGLHAQFFLDKEGRLCKRYEEAEFSFPRVSEKENLVAPFEVLNAPLYRFAFVETKEGKYLFSDFHHMIMDGFSLKMFLDEFASLYQGGKPQEKEAFNAFDDAEVKQAHRESPAFQEDKDYFEKNFGSLDVDSSLTEDLKEDVVRYAKIRIPLEKLKDKDVVKRLQEAKVRRSSFFLSAYALTLAQATFAEEVFFLTVWNGRNEKTKKDFGMFVRTLPVYINGLDQGKVLEYLERVDKGQKETMDHSFFSYSDLVSTYGVSAENLFSYQGDYYYHTKLNGKEVPVSVLPVKDGKEKTAIELFKDEDSYFIDFEYRADLYTEEMIRAFARRFEHFALELLVKDNIEDIDPCDEVDKEVNRKVNDKDLTGYDLDRDLLQDIEKHIQEKPDCLAISAAGEEYTYGQIGEISDRICDAILSHGLKPNDVVSLLIGRNALFPISALGAIKAGVGYQPLDPGYPDERLDFMIMDADAKLLIADRGLETKLTSYKGPILFTDEIPSLKLLSLPRPAYKKEDLFIMLYTSGSTGKPKGVELMRGNLSVFVQWQRKANGIDENTRAFTYASFGFDASMYDFYAALTNGAPIFVIDEGMRLDLKRMDAFITENNCNFGLMTTQVGRQFVEMGYGKTLKTLTVGGEKLVPIEPPHFTLINGYGPTECTITITSFKVDRLYHRVPIGQGYPINKLYILDKKKRPLPFGVPGYLYCAGPQVGRGYKNRPEENAKAFLENPFEGGIWKKMYFTGDVVRMLRDGTMDFIGRKDGQIKIRGFRIEMSEVERVIRDFPNIEDATVNAYPAASGGFYLCGYVVSKEKVDFAALKAFILERKPYYMCPEAFMQLDAIPLNQNGKVNKRALPMPERKAEDIVLPENDTEKKILKIAEKVLGYEGVSVTLSLFDAGLTSISSIKFITLFSEEMGFDLTTATLKENPSIRELALLQGTKEEEVEEVLDSYPLTKTQQGIYVETLSHPGSTVYDIPLLYRLSPEVDLKRLEEAILKALQNHPYLNSHLVLGNDGEPRVAPLNEEMKVEHIEDEPAMPFMLTPFDLMKGPFYKAVLYKGKAPYLFLDTHHVASDGTSLAILLEDIEKAYEGEELLPEKKNGFQIGLAESKASKEEIEAEKAFYASYLEGLDCLSLPRKEFLEEVEEKPLEEDIDLELPMDEVSAFLKKEGGDRNGFYNAAFAYALSKWNGSDDALFASIYSGRDSSSTARSVTMMVKTLPLYVNLPEDGLVASYLKDVSSRLEKAQGKTLYSFAEASHDFGVDAKVMFAYQGDGFLPDSIGGKKAELIHLNGDEVKAPFSVDCLEKEGKIRLHFEYSSSLYLPETMKYFARLFEMVLRGFIKEKKLSEIVLLDEKTKAEMDVFNQTEDPILYNDYIEALELRAKEHPEKPAVIGIDESLTYKEFLERIYQVAHYLASFGLGPEDKVVVMMPRVANAYVAREGILCCGACFVPVDPAYPDERILSIIEDSEAKYVLTVSSIYEAKKDSYPGVSFLLMEDALKKGSKDAFKASINPSSLAYCIFTSGSTGKPKGVMIEHHSLANLISNVPHNYVADEYANRSSVAVSLASFSFDLSIQEEFVPLANGLTVLIASEDEILNPVLLSKRMKQYGVDVLTTTPSYLNNVLDIEEVMTAFRNLKIIDLGAEALPASMVQKMREKGMNCRIGNGYGPTEATVTCTFDVVESSRITIGYPDNNVKTYIIDAQGRRLPFGAMGELLIGGEGVARGYVHRDDLTKEKFIHLEGVYAYRSGDLSRISYDGRIEFFGRKDNQVKLRGLRVELDEVENAIASYPGVSRAVVAVKTTSEDGQFLVGYYLSQEEIPEASLKEHLGKTLTPYMIPKVLMHLESIPLTPNGKVNKKALPDPVVTHKAGEAKKIRLPRNDTQKTLYEIFKHVLGVEELSIDDDFFDLGGTSLSASKVTMLSLEKGLPVAYSDVFDYPSVLELAAHCLAGEAAEAPIKEAEEEAKPQEGLEHNVVEEVDGVKEGRKEFSSILLTGATGFLGTHVLRELLENSSSNILLLVHGNKRIAAVDRVTGLLAYYFDCPYEEEIAKRVKIVESDVTSPDLQALLEKESFDLIINCAAVVKHFANDDSIERVNLGGVKNLIEVALAHKARLVQISTLSVAGENINHAFSSSRRIHEFEIDFGQNVDNKYIHSKIEAEKAINEAILHRGLDGKVIRVGNLMGRARDGEFQVNSSTNSFMNSIRAYKKLGVFPVSAADSTIDFSPIDEVAKTILLLSSTSSKYTLFHSANSHEIELGDVIAAMNDYGYKIDMVDDASFQKALSDYIQDESRQMDVSALISYDSSSSASREYILSDNTFSVKALYRLGYKWPITDGKYLARSIASLDTLGYFE